MRAGYQGLRAQSACMQQRRGAPLQPPRSGGWAGGTPGAPGEGGAQRVAHAYARGEMHGTQTEQFR